MKHISQILPNVIKQIEKNFKEQEYGKDQINKTGFLDRRESR